MYRPSTPRELWAFIGAHFDLWLPWKTFTPGNSSPFAFVADAFFRTDRHLAAWANRSGLKTLTASVLAALEFGFHDGLTGRVLSGSEDQAKNLYGYWAKWCFLPLLRDRLEGDPGRLLTRIAGGDFEILAASQRRVRGGKVQRLFLDEYDEIDPVLSAAAVGMLDSREAMPARMVYTSTWHNPAGPMGQLIAEAEKKAVTLHRWNVWESIRRCPKARHQDGKGCQACPLAEPCMGMRRERGESDKTGIAAEACGLFAIEDAITQYQQWSAQQWAAEAECKRPSLTGTVYPQFDRAKHVRHNLDFSDDLPTYRAIDWGLNNFVCLWIQADKRGNTYVVDEYWAPDTRLKEHAEYIKRQDCGIRVDATYCDPAGRNRNDQTGISDVQAFRTYGIPTTYSLSSWSRELANGINLIRAALLPASGKPRLFIAGKCGKLIEALESYQLRRVNQEYVDEPVKPQACDHWVDALRYYFVNRHGGQAPIVQNVRIS